METVATQELHLVRTPEITKALDDLALLITEAFPDTTFNVHIGHDPVGFYLTAYLADFDQALDVLAVIAERQLEIQVEEDLPVYVDLDQQTSRATPAVNGTTGRRRNRRLSA